MLENMYQPFLKCVRFAAPISMLSCAIGLVHFSGAKAAPLAYASISPQTKSAVAQNADAHFASKLHLVTLRAGETFAVDNISGKPGAEIPITITLPPHKSDDYLLLSFRGLPKNFRLTSGFGTAEAWFVSARDVATLQLLPPKDFVGFFELQVQLVRGPDITPETIYTKVAVGLADPALSAEPVRSITPAPVDLPANSVVDQAPSVVDEAPPQKAADDEIVSSLPTANIDPAEEERMLKMAENMLRQNDIPAARLIYGRIGRQGSQQGALMMAKTYDPAFLDQFDIAGLSEDREKAKYWYEIAAQLGSTDASQRLLALGAPN